MFQEMVEREQITIVFFVKEIQEISIVERVEDNENHSDEYKDNSNSTIETEIV